MVNKQFYSWNDYEVDMQSLKHRLDSDEYDVVVGIARGGLIPATELSHHLNLPLIPLIWQTRDGTPPEEIPGDVAQAIFQKRVLLVDDICDSGETYAQVYDAIMGENNQLALSLTSCCLHYNRGEIMFRPDMWAVEINKRIDPIWLVYPWERNDD